jgi:hypothetical protein
MKRSTIHDPARGRSDGLSTRINLQDGDTVMVERCVSRLGHISLAGHQLMAAEIIGGCRVAIRIEPATERRQIDLQRLGLRRGEVAEALERIGGDIAEVNPHDCSEASFDGHMIVVGQNPEHAQLRGGPERACTG